MKVIAIRTFSWGFGLYTTGDQLDLPDTTAKALIDNGFVKPYEEGFKTLITKQPEPVVNATKAVTEPPAPPPAKQTRKKK